MKKIFYLLIALCLFSFSFSLSSCHCKKKAASVTAATPEVTRDFEKEGYIKATVQFTDLDACKFLLLLANETKLEPSKELPPEFQLHDLAVWVKYVPKKGGMSACMAGQLVDISDIQLRK